jgi:hypothetical protein
MMQSYGSAAWAVDDGRCSRRIRSPRRGWEIAGIIAGFIFAWPLALAYLVWKFAGYPLPDKARTYLRETLGWTFETRRTERFAFGGTGNVAFEEYRQAELARLEQERRRLDEESRAFSAFVEELKRAKDREEFDAFMAKRRSGSADEPGRSAS